MKKRFSLFWACCLLLILLPLQAAAFPIDGTIGTSGAPWRLYDDGRLVVSPGHIDWNWALISPWDDHNNDIEEIVFNGSGFTAERLRSLFNGLSNVQTITGLELLDTSGVTHMNATFNGASSLVSIEDLSGWDVSNVETMYSMFRDASSLEKLDLSGWNTGNVTSMGNMFRGTNSLASIGDLSGWDTSNVTTMGNMFLNASSLEELALSSWDTSSVTNMAFMFSGTSSLEELDLSGWDTSNVTTMDRMFQNTNLARLDLSGWDTSAVTNMFNMFVGATNLRQLTLGEEFSFMGNAALPPVPNTTHTGFWINVGSGTVYAPAGPHLLTSAQLIATFDGSTMADTWVWQSRRSIAPLADHVFPPAPVGYGTQSPHEVTVTSTGTESTGDLTITVTGTSFLLSATSLTSVDSGQTASFTVVPDIDLSPGFHIAEVTVSNVANGISESFEVRFYVSTSPPPLPPPPPPPADDFSSDAGSPLVQETYEIHLAYMFGDNHGNFRPHAAITRAEVAAVLVRTQLADFTSPEALPAGMSTFDTFADVQLGYWYFYYVAWAYHAGLITGDPPDANGVRAFRPDAPITRQEFAAMTARINAIYQLSGNFAQFSDWDQTHDWARQYVYTAFRTGWMVGDNQGNFRPLANISRAEVATTVNRTLDRIDSRIALAELYLRNPQVIRDFPDVSEPGWYFPSTLAAANNHRLGRGVAGAVVWKEIVPFS
ncbi:MAG: BspA family leucine-rich repeat surface protein [Oscillospiraceae bacterium]|nr:BspA family leucine-rich repeat surface protein [Oscillospiraceae bacterium]